MYPPIIRPVRSDDIRTTPRLSSFYDIDLSTAVAPGKRLWFHTPEKVVIFAVRAGDVTALKEDCLFSAGMDIPDPVEVIAREITGEPARKIYAKLGRRRTVRA